MNERFHTALKTVIKRAIVLNALGDFEMKFQNRGRFGTGRLTMRRWLMATRKRHAGHSDWS
jgi:hypothetical protein